MMQVTKLEEVESTQQNNSQPNTDKVLQGLVFLSSKADDKKQYD